MIKLSMKYGIIAMLGVLCMTVATSAHAFDRDDRRVVVRHDRDWHEHEQAAYAWHRHRVVERGAVYEPGVVYAPPAVVEAPPPPPPGINLIIPFNIR
jgi:hypothetical protein